MVVDRLWDILESIRDCLRIATREGTYLRQYVLVISGALHYTCFSRPSDVNRDDYRRSRIILIATILLTVGANV